MDNETFKGTVIWFNSRLGTGFIKRNDDKKDIFVHYSDINMEGYKTLLEGDIVSFEESYSFKDRLKAANVTLIERKNNVKSKE